MLYITFLLQGLTENKRRNSLQECLAHRTYWRNIRAVPTWSKVEKNSSGQEVLVKAKQARRLWLSLGKMHAHQEDWALIIKKILLSNNFSGRSEVQVSWDQRRSTWTLAAKVRFGAGGPMPASAHGGKGRVRGRSGVPGQWIECGCAQDERLNG
jgi:hypothetical protein